MIRKNLMKSFSVIMAAMIAMMSVACGANTVQDETAQIETVEESKLEDTLIASAASHSSDGESGKVETVYVKTDANGAVNDIIVSEWLKNADASSELSDATQLKDIVNVKGSESFTDNGDGTLTWNASGADIYYQGTTDKQLPVDMHITYTLDGKEISPEELAGKSGKVTIRFDYENKEKQTVEVNGKQVEVYTPFAMVSGMMLDADKFANVEISNGKVISDGGNYIVMGVAVPGLKESLDIDDEKWEEINEDGDLDEKLSNHFEVTADTTDFELGMTITMASSDILSDFGLTDLSDSDKIDDLKDDMSELNDGSNKLVDGTKELKDGTTDLRDGVAKLYDGSKELKDGTKDLKDGTVSLYDGTNKLYDGTGTLADGTGSLVDGTEKLYDGTGSLYDGTAKLADGTGSLLDGSKKLADGTGSLAAGSKKLSDGTTSLYDGTGSLVTGTGSLYEGVVKYTAGASKINDGASQLATGATTAKSGADQLVNGMKEKDFVGNADKLASGASQVDAGVNKLINTVDSMMSSSVQELETQKSQIQAALDFLNGNGNWDANTQAGFVIISKGQITDQVTATRVVEGRKQAEDSLADISKRLNDAAGKIDEGLAEAAKKQAAMNASQDSLAAAQESTETTDVSMEDNDAMLFLTADFGELADTPSDESTEDTSTESSDEVTEEASSNDSTEEIVTNENVNVEETVADNSEATLTTEVSNENAQATEGAATEGSSLEGNDEDELQALNLDVSLLATQNETIDPSTLLNANPNAASSESTEESEEVKALKNQISELQSKNATLEATNKVLNDKLTGLGQTMVQQMTETATQLQGISAGLKESASGLEKGVPEALYVISSYNQLHGAAEAAITTINLIETRLSSSASLKTNSDVAALLAGTSALADGTKAYAEGAKTVYNGAVALDTGLGTLSAGATQLQAGTNELVTNNGALVDGASQLKNGATKLQAGASELKDGASQLNDGASQVNVGATQLKDGASQLNDGATQLKDGASQLKNGVSELKDGAYKLKDGAFQLKDGAYQLNEGARQLDDGATKLNDGAGELYDGVGELNDGAIKLDDGVQELLDGVIKLDEEGIKKLYEAFDGDLTDFTDRLTAIREAGENYTSFGGASEDVDSSVKFIIKTDAIKSL